MNVIRNNSAKKVFFDISSLIDYIRVLDRYSGIQRVVVEILSEISRIADLENLYVCWIDDSSKKYTTIKFSEISLEIFSSPSELRRVFFPHLVNRVDIQPLNRYKTKPAKYFYHRLRFDIMSLLGKDNFFKRWGLTAKEWRKMRRKPVANITVLSRLKGDDFFSIAEKGDNLLLLDSSWFPDQITAFKRAAQLGANIYTLIYDLIPIKAPQFTVDPLSRVFMDWLNQSTTYTTKYLSISDSARCDMIEFLDAHNIKKDIVVVPLTQSGLGSQVSENKINPKRSSLEWVNPEIYQAWEHSNNMGPEIIKIITTPYVLCVGTIELRKNMWRTAMAWKYLIDQGHVDLPQLVFAGRLGCHREQFEQLMDATKNIYGYVHVIDGPTDAQLHVLYQNCQHALMTSLYEGWGLPVGEALAYGKTAVVANNSSLPEVGGDLVEYCDAHSIRSIADAVLRLQDPARRSELENRIKTAKLRQWSDVARDMLAAIKT